MLNPIDIIQAINKALQPFLINGTSDSFVLTQYKNSNVFRLKITQNSSDAFNDYGNGGDIVKVIKWFSDYWLFVDITFQHPKGIIVSLSIFQGGEDISQKNQLFRAEWDDYEDGLNAHAQPHWHFLTNKSVENTVNTWVEMVPDARETFEQVLNEEKSKIIDLSQFHFAMNGDWWNTYSHVHLINEETKLEKWFGGLLAYLKEELEYIDKKRGV